MSYRTLHGDNAPLNDPKVKQHRELTQELHKLYADKNADYGDSFHKTFDEYGMTSVLIRLSDKLNRLKALQSTDSRVDESIRDTLMDLAGYCLLTIMELEEPSEAMTTYARLMSGWGDTDAGKMEYPQFSERVNHMIAEEEAMQESADNYINKMIQDADEREVWG